MSNGKRRKERVGGAGQGSEVEEEAFGAALKSIQSGAFPDRAMGSAGGQIHCEHQDVKANTTQ